MNRNIGVCLLYFIFLKYDVHRTIIEHALYLQQMQYDVHILWIL